MADVAFRAIGAEREFIQYHLQRLTGKTQGELNELLADAGEKTLFYDDQIYRAAGLHPKALSDSEALGRLVQAGLDKTMQLFENLTSTTADTATRQFENALDSAYMDLTSGAFSYQDAVKSAVKACQGKASTRLPIPAATRTNWMLLSAGRFSPG